MKHTNNCRRETLGGINIAKLSGTWEEMGRQYGELFATELNYIYNKKIIGYIGHGQAYGEAVKIGYTLYDSYPARFKAFFRGMEQSSGMSLEMLTVVNAVECIYQIKIPEKPGCTGMCVWGGYSEGGRLIFGRNYDYCEIFRTFEDYIAVTVLNPDDGSCPTAIVGYIGEIYCVTGLNKNRIFVELNNGFVSDKAADKQRIAGIAQLLMLELDADSLEYVDRFFRTSLGSEAYIIGVADGKRANSYDWCTRGAKQSFLTPEREVMATANHFLNPEWQIPEPEDKYSWDSPTRRANIFRLAERYKGHIGIEKMKEIMKIRLEDGGFYEDLNVYQIIAVPEDLTLYIRRACHDEWIKFDLRDYFD